MGAVWLRSRAELRNRWKAWLVVLLLAGVGGGIAMGAFAGAERVEHTYPRFVEAGHPMDVLVPGASPFGLVGGVDLTKVGRLPEVAETADASAMLLFAGSTPDGRLIGPGDVFPVAAAGNALGTTFEKFTILEGRAAHPWEIREATASFLAAEQLGLKVGDTVRLHFFRSDRFVQIAAALLTQFDQRLNAPKNRGSESDYARLADGPDIKFRIVGIEASPGEFPPLPADISPVIHLTRAFYERWNDKVVQSPLLYTRLARGTADLPSFERRVERMAGDQPVAFVTTRATQAIRVQRAIRVQATALRVFAFIVLAAFVCLILQTISRQVRVESRDDPVLRTFGMSSGQLIALPLLWAAIVAVPAAILAAGIAILLSPLGVVGLAKQADPHPGFTIDAPVIGIGIVCVLVAIPLLTLWPALRRARAVRGRFRENLGRPSRIATWLARTGASPSSSVGVAFGLSAGRGASSVPVQSAVVGFTLGVGLLVATLGFGASLQRVLDTPRLYGWTWDIKSGAPALPNIGNLVVPALEADDDVAGAAAGTVIQVNLEDTRVDALAVTLVKGTLAPEVTQGRAPRTTGELLVGSRTLDAIGADIGDTVTVRVGTRSARVKLVGTAVFPPFGDSGQFGSGALMTYAQLQELVPAAKQNVFLLKLAPDTSIEREFVHMRNALEPLPTRTAQRPNDLDNLDSIGGLQFALVAILATLAAATLAHTLLTSVRRRRKSIGLLRTMGFARRQVSAVVLIQALTLVVVALVIGILVGTVGGRLAWTLFADNLGLTATSVIPWTGLFVLVPVSLALAVAVAAIPALIASRTHPATVLRDE